MTIKTNTYLLLMHSGCISVFNEKTTSRSYNAYRCHILYISCLRYVFAAQTHLKQLIKTLVIGWCFKSGEITLKNIIWIFFLQQLFTINSAKKIKLRLLFELSWKWKHRKTSDLHSYWIFAVYIYPFVDPPTPQWTSSLRPSLLCSSILSKLAKKNG